MRDHFPDPPVRPGDADRLTAEPAVWTGRATNRVQWLLAVAGAACLALGIELAVLGDWTSGVIALSMSVVGCVAAGLLMLYGTLPFVHVAVRVDSQAVEIRCGHIGLPRRRIPLAHVVHAEVDPRVTPRQWGGWGYRWRPEQGTAIVVRRGEGIVVTLGDGRTFTVTVDDAEAAVRAIRDRLALHPGTPATA
ncbi:MULTISPECIES: hypothetical protein [Streptomyces]|uniref:Lipoprotein n=1 Tax=Streptomyces tsukubensis (strain DSM 42081 / NBRC 108919 / NRRL 18488 / 9993) TaxID=1114943 RepID=I2MU12_STRT9|nr:MULTISPECIES: hypothetical protein [Streptomyces]AZK92805.1 hypothetical protein B7R87_02105 [Streptomyces tsukubensis]EIF88259.1 hypothetical protein [Streptomyces tsukubensis NRRL18488]MYS64881.1 hypothetical protein [Streptomyces sp. SID5473]QKM71028.1 hypothetical protein STSU_031725 [Streptomyces tsukubensis NRRL18488]TAI41715.1 hypothetical protein EWI31_25610 [Streptomyces tsukubensis]